MATIEEEVKFRSRLDEHLTRIGWSQAYFSERIKVHPKTVQRWVRGEMEPPQSVYLYLDLVERGMGLS